MQTLQLRMDSKWPSAASKPLPPTPSPPVQRAVNVLACGRTDHRSAIRLRTDTAAVTVATENSGGGGCQTAMGDLLADELNLKNGDRQLEAKCMTLESETVHLQAEANRTAVRWVSIAQGMSRTRAASGFARSKTKYILILPLFLVFCLPIRNLRINAQKKVTSKEIKIFNLCNS